MTAHDDLVELPAEHMTDEERAGWLAFDRTLRAQIARGTSTYAAVPHALLRMMHLPAYPLASLLNGAGAELCGLNGYHRDELAEVDWICLLWAGHDRDHERVRLDADAPGGAVIYDHVATWHGWEAGMALTDARPLFVVADAVRSGVRPELDDVGEELLYRLALAEVDLDRVTPYDELIP